MKKIFSNKIFLVALTAVVFTGIGAYANSRITANDVYYIKANNEEVTVASALDDIYTNATPEVILRNITPTTTVERETGEKQGDIYLSKNVTKGSYLVMAMTNSASDNGSTINNHSEGVTGNSSALPITVTNGTCTQLYRYYDVHTTENPLSTGKYYLLAEWWRLWKCDFTQDGSITVDKGSTYGASIYHPADFNLIVTKLN